MAEKKKNPFTVFFVANSEVVETLPRNSIAIYPSTGSWSSLIEKAYCYFTVVIDKPEYSGGMHIGFTKERNPSLVIIEALNKSGTLFTPEYPFFFSMLPTIETYRSFISQFGVETANLILLAMNDMVALQDLPQLPPWYEEATYSDAFVLFLQKTDALFAYRNAKSVLKGLAFEKRGRISRRLNLNFKLPAFSNPHDLTFVFGEDDLLPTRISVLIGKNGTGKSRALFTLVKSALSGDRRFSQADGERIVINSILAIGSLQEASRTFPAPRKDARIPYRRLTVSRKKARSGAKALSGMILELLIDRKYLAGRSRWELFRSAINGIVEYDQLALPTIKYGPEKHPFLKYIPLRDLEKDLDFGTKSSALKVSPNEDPVMAVGRMGEPLPLSSGQVYFLSFAAQLCLHIENGSLVLLDEPEIHLHPNFISKLIGLLDTVLELSGSISIIATHSAYFVREVPRTQVQILRENPKGHIEVSLPRLKTIGAEVGAISHFIFGDEAFGELVERVYSKLASNPTLARARLLDIKDELPTEALMHLQRKLGVN
jgi:predicted ATPase